MHLTIKSVTNYIFQSNQSAFTNIYGDKESQHIAIPIKIYLFEDKAKNFTCGIQANSGNPSWVLLSGGLPARLLRALVKASREGVYEQLDG